MKTKLPPAKFPSRISPQLATLVDRAPEGEEWVHELKYDGYRLLTFKNARSIKLVTRNHNDWTEKFLSVKAAIAKLKLPNVVLDGEVVVLDDEDKSDFQLLQNSLKEGSEKYIYYVFDIIYHDKYDISTLPLSERKAILRKLLPRSTKGIVRYSEHLNEDGAKVFQHACKLGLEGIISKDINSPYVQKRSDTWLKTKCIKRQEFIIGGYLPPERGKRAYFRSLMLGTFNDKKELVYNGNVGTGFTQTSLMEIHKLLQKYKSDEMPFNKKPGNSRDAVWLKPVVVCEIEFTEWTTSNSLRHPSFKGIRLDKSAKNVKKEKPQLVKLALPKKPKKI